MEGTNVKEVVKGNYVEKCIEMGWQNLNVFGDDNFEQRTQGVYPV